MAKHKADIGIGMRAVEEAVRIYPNLSEREITQRIGLERKIFWEWRNGTTPGGYALQRLYYAGCDIIFILTGRKACEHNVPSST